MGYASDGVISHSHNSTNYAITPKVSAYADSTDKPRLFTFVQDSSAGKKTYINGTLSASDATNTSQLSGVATLAIGKGYTGEIGEIAIFTKVLTPQDREEVEDYLGKKWTRKINRASAASCINGIVTDSGCSNVCSTSVVTGVTTPTQVSDGDSGTLSCNTASGYSGTVSYNCSNGNLNPGGSCSAITCTASGTGYSKTGLAYAASGGGSFACDTGYSGTLNYTCTSTGAATGVTGTCAPITCTAAAGTGYLAQSNLPYAASGSGSFNCTTGYSGTKNYTCTTTGAATITGGTCSAITCTATAGTGYLAQTNLPYAASGSGTFSCTSGYTGTIITPVLQLVRRLV